jgi:predicted nucleotidyltransferase component of viral defense system
MNNLFDKMLSRYDTRTSTGTANALREVMQQATLAGLYRGGFFTKAAFYGGTCLRLFHGSERFSEDMDFSLLAEDDSFSLESYFEPIAQEFKALGRDITIVKKEKLRATNIESAFLKDNTAVYNLHFKAEKKVKIKVEVDIHPPPGFSTVQELSLLPFSFMTRCYSLPDLYARKMHALLFRVWRNRVKGRDWFDWEWYVRKEIPLNFAHFCERVRQFGSWTGGELTHEVFFRLLRERIGATNMGLAKADVFPFIKNPEILDIWSADYFERLMERMKFVAVQ